MSVWTNHEEKLLRDTCSDSYGPILVKQLSCLFPRHSKSAVKFKMKRLGVSTKTSRPQKRSTVNSHRVMMLRRMVNMQNRVFL